MKKSMHTTCATAFVYQRTNKDLALVAQKHEVEGQGVDREILPHCLEPNTKTKEVVNGFKN